MKTKTATIQDNPWQQLRRLTPARIALGHAGTSLPTAAHLAFQYAHAQARDAVHLPFDHADVNQQLQQQGQTTLVLQSAAANRHIYLQRPDLGRQLDTASRHLLDQHASKHPEGYDLVLVIADGLSALAVHRHSVPLLALLRQHTQAEGWSQSPVILVQQGRVAIADEIGQRLGGKMVLILIGERPGLSSPDSLGLYFTYAPEVGLSDARRNCISNVRQEGLTYASACHRLIYLMRHACQRQLSGVDLKEETELPLLNGDQQEKASGIFLLGK